jgi:hypothetical protein
MAVTAAVTAYGAEQLAIRKYLNRPGFEWTCEGHLTFRACHLPGLESAAADSRRDANTDLRTILRVAGAADYARKLLIYVFVVDSVRRLTELLRISAYGPAEPKDHAIFVVAGHPEVLAHELAHEVMANLWGPSEPWISEGFAAKIGGSGNADDRLLRLLRNRGYIPLADLVNPSWNAYL